MGDDPSETKGDLSTTTFAHDPIFGGASYIGRYRIALERLRFEGEMDATCLAVSSRNSGATYPDATMSFDAFAAAIHARVTEVLGMFGE